MREWGLSECSRSLSENIVSSGHCQPGETQTLFSLQDNGYMKMTHRRRFLRLSAAAGVVGTAGCLSALSTRSDTHNEDSTKSGDRPDNRGLVLAVGGPSSLAKSDDVDSGWVHVSKHGDSYHMTFDVRISHERHEEVPVELVGVPQIGYTLRFTTASASETNPGAITSDPDHEFGTQITGSGTLPIEFEKLHITIDGRTLQTIEEKRKLAIMRQLPDPIEA